MKKTAITLVLMLFSTLSFAQIEGKWKTIDDVTGKPKSIVEIFKKSDGKYYGRVQQLLGNPAVTTCAKCTDDRKNKPITGMEVIRGLSKDGSEYNDGTITDPKTGKTYKCLLTRSGDKLNVRGYVGIPAIGRSQTWYKVN